MKDMRSTTERLCDMLNEMGIRTTIVGREEAKSDMRPNSGEVESAHRQALEEITRIGRNSKRFAK